MLDGWCREKGTRKDPCQPLSPQIFCGIQNTWGTVCALDYKRVLFHATSILAFFAALRISGLVVVSKQDTLRRALERRDVAIHDGHVALIKWASKIDQMGKGRHVILEACGDRELCLVETMKRYLAV